MRAFWLLLARDLRLALRRPGQTLLPIGFFAMVTAMFPLALSPRLEELRAIAPGVLWVGALLAALLSLDHMLRDDAADGTLEQLVTGSDSLVSLVYAKVAANWVMTGLPLAVLAPLLGAGLGVSMESSPGVVLSLLLGTACLSLVGAAVAALTLGARRGGILLTLLTLPLAVPVLIFGARATKLVIEGGAATGAFYLLAAVTVLALSLAPLATAAVLRIAVE